MLVRGQRGRPDGAASMTVLKANMALFGMVWLLRVRAEMRRCAKCRREQQQQQQQLQLQLQLHPHPPPATISQHSDDHLSASSAATFYTSLDTPGTYCEVHGYVPPKEDIQEFYELTLLDDTKSIQQKTAETIRIANKWEASDGPITPTYGNNDD